MPTSKTICKGGPCPPKVIINTINNSTIIRRESRVMRNSRRLRTGLRLR